MIDAAIATDQGSWQRIAVAGALPRSTDGQLLYAIGDIHGCYDQLHRLLALIAADAALRAGARTPILVLLGDYVDRGPASAQVLEAVTWLRENAAYEVHALAGNHERLLLDFLADPLRGAAWLRYGGIETLASYGVATAEEADPITLRDLFLAALPEAHYTLLQELDLVVEVGDYAFVHAGIRPDVALDRQVADDLLWIRKGFLDYGGQHAKMIVHGHTWEDDRPQLEANRFGIDTGVYATDVLTALRLDGIAADYVQVGRRAH